MTPKPFVVKFMKAAALLLSAAAILSSCQKVVTIDLNQANPQLVVEGIVTDQPGPYTVKLSKTGNYFVPALVFPPVSGARVIIKDDLGQKDTLKETVAGTYETNSLQGTVGRTYSLDVLTNGNAYSASSSLPQKVMIDSLYATPRQTSNGQPGYDIWVMFRDPPELGNYYRLNVRVDSLVSQDSVDGRRYRLYSDKLINGNEITERVRAGRLVVSGDSVTVELLSIDKAMYDYFTTLNDILISERAATSLSPANPNTNLDNGALGYFGAWAIDQKIIVLQ